MDNITRLVMKYLTIVLLNIVVIYIKSTKLYTLCLNMYTVFVLLGLSIIVFPLHFNARGSIDMYTRDGILKGYFFILKVFTLHLRYDKDEYGNSIVYLFNKKKNKVIDEVHLNTDRNDKQSISNIFVRPIIGNINITDIEIYAKIGVENDAFLSAIAVASFKTIYCGFLSFVKSWQSLRTSEEFSPVYNKNIFELKFLSVFTFNIADVIYGLIIQAIEKKHRKQKKLQRKN